MSDIKFACPQCQQHIECGAEYAGMELACPTCSTRIIVPGTVLAAEPVMAQGREPAPSPPIEMRPAASPSGGCPSCGVALPRGAVLCTRCGYNLATGQRTIASRPAPQGPKVMIDGKAWYATSFPYFGAFAVFMLVLFFIGQMRGEMNGFKAALFLLSVPYICIVGITAIVCLFRDSVMKGLLYLLATFLGVGFIGLLYMIYWVYVESGNNALKAAYAVHLLLIILLIVSVVISGTHGHAH